MLNLGRSLEQNRRALLWLKHQRVFQVQNGFLRVAGAAPLDRFLVA